MKTVLLFTTIAAFAFATPAEAQLVAAPAAITVKTTGLDLGTNSGQRLLDLRILHAASALCGTPSSADGGSRAKYKQCRAEVQENASAARAQAIEFARSRQTVEVASNR